MIASHLLYDTSRLEACAATCFAWYTVATPHLHHTITLGPQDVRVREGPNPLVASYELGLLPLVRKLQFLSYELQGPWMGPETFSSGGLRHFSALVNLQDLVVMDLDLDLSKFFGHFSPTLRSITLLRPRGSPRQLLDFLKLFPELDDIKIIRYIGMAETQNAPGTSAPKSRGRCEES